MKQQTETNNEFDRLEKHYQKADYVLHGVRERRPVETRGLRLRTSIGNILKPELVARLKGD